MNPRITPANTRLTFYLARMAERGFSGDQVLNGTGLAADDLSDERFRPKPDHYRGVIHNMLALTGQPFLGIALGHEFKISDLGVLGYAALSSSKLAESRDLFRKYDALVEHIITPRSSVEGERWLTTLTESFPLGDIAPFAVEEFVSRTMSLATALTNQPFPVLELHMTYAEPERLDVYVERFACPMYFNQTRNLVVWDVEHFEDPISFANQEVFSLLEQQCQMLVNRLADESLLSTKIRDNLVKTPGEFPTLEEMARRLNMGARTLRRRLVDEDLTYQQILDDTRQDLAIQYLKYTTLQPKEIGYLLGYSSVSNFRRAFRKWTDKRVSDFRNSD